MAVIRHEAWAQPESPAAHRADTPEVSNRTAQTEKRYALLAFHLANQCVAERCEILIR